MPSLTVPSVTGSEGTEATEIPAHLRGRVSNSLRQLFEEMNVPPVLSGTSNGDNTRQDVLYLGRRFSYPSKSRQKDTGLESDLKFSIIEQKMCPIKKPLGKISSDSFTIY